MSGSNVGGMVLRITAGLVWLFQAYPKFGQNYLSERLAALVGAMAGPDNPWHFYSGFLHGVVLTHIALFAYLSLVGDVAVGVCLVVGLLTPYAAFVGIVLNLNYALAAGWMSRADYPLNFLLIVLEIFVMATAAGKTAGLDGLLAGRDTGRRSRRY